jgi:YVTN family beta-propeller protein
VVDTAGHEALATIAVVKGPHGIAVTPDDRHVLVCNNGAEVISVIDVEESEVVTEIKTLPRPNYICLAPDRNRAFVTHKTGAVSAIALDELKVQATVDVGDSPERIVVGRNGARLYVNDTKGEEVGVIDGNSMQLLTRVPVDASGWHQGMAFAPDGAKLYAVNHSGGSVSVLDTEASRVLKRIAVGDGPSQIITVGG